MGKASDIWHKLNDNKGSAPSGGNSNPTTPEQGKRNASAQKAADNIANVNYGDAAGADSFDTFKSYWGNNTSSYVPEGLGQSASATMVGTGKGAKPETAVGDGGQSGWNNIQKLEGMSTNDIMDYYMGNSQRNYNADIGGASEYLTGEYNKALNDPTSEFYKSVQEKRNNTKNDPDQLYKYIFDGMQQNSWDEGNVIDILSSVAGGDQEMLENLAAGLDAYEANEAEKIARANAGLSSITSSDMNKAAANIANRAGREAGFDVMQAVNDWAAQTGATPEEAQKVLGLVDSNYRDTWGFDPSFASKYQAPAQQLPPEIQRAQKLAGKSWDTLSDEEKNYYYSKDGLAQREKAFGDAYDNFVNDPTSPYHDAATKTTKDAFVAQRLADDPTALDFQEKIEQYESAHKNDSNVDPIMAALNTAANVSEEEGYQTRLANGNPTNADLTEQAFRGGGSLDAIYYNQESYYPYGMPEQAPKKTGEAGGFTGWWKRNRAENIAESQGKRRGTPEFEELVQQLMTQLG